MGDARIRLKQGMKYKDPGLLIQSLRMLFQPFNDNLSGLGTRHPRQRHTVNIQALISGTEYSICVQQTLNISHRPVSIGIRLIAVGRLTFEHKKQLISTQGLGPGRIGKNAGRDENRSNDTYTQPHSPIKPTYSTPGMHRK
jgi:hypothetical protein